MKTPNNKFTRTFTVLALSAIGLLFLLSLISCSPRIYVDETGSYVKVARNDYIKIGDSEPDQHYKLERVKPVKGQTVVAH